MIQDPTHPIHKGSFMSSTDLHDCLIWEAPKTVSVLQYMTTGQAGLLAHCLRLAATGTPQEDIYPTVVESNPHMPLTPLCQCGRNCADCQTAENSNRWLVNLIATAMDEFDLFGEASRHYTNAHLTVMDTKSLQLVLRHAE